MHEQTRYILAVRATSGHTFVNSANMECSLEAHGCIKLKPEKVGIMYHQTAADRARSMTLRCLPANRARRLRTGKKSRSRVTPYLSLTRSTNTCSYLLTMKSLICVKQCGEEEVVKTFPPPPICPSPPQPEPHPTPTSVPT